MKLPVVPEKDIQRSILDYLGIKGYFFWRNNTGATTASYGGKKRFFQYGKTGSGDIIGLLKDGRFFSIEVKRKGKHPSEHQARFIEDVQKTNGVAFVAYSVDDVVANGL